MKTKFTRVFPVVVSVGLLIGACTNELNQTEDVSVESVKAQSTNSLELTPKGHFDLDNSLLIKDYQHQLNLSNVVEPSECGPTPFNDVADFYNDQLIEGFISVWDGTDLPIEVILADYFVINQIAALEGYNGDYFGENGEYTNFMKKSVRSLESFWNMPDLITVNGQHTSTLEDLYFMRYVYENYSSAPPEVIEEILGIASYFNTNSDQIPENPFYAADGFATFDRTIVIGDGIVTLLEDTGIDPKVVWLSILAHEWGHQIQFLNFGDWQYPVPAFIGTPESTRMTELEADFLTGYYLTHKRGATYNWKRVEGFLSAFFNIGDCGFDNDGHHGTPAQRMAAAKAGFNLANKTKKKGQILSQQEVHNDFLAKLDLIIDANIY